MLVAYQVGFDLAEGATQEYLAEVGRAIPESSEDIVVTNLRSILSGEKTIRLHLDFLFKNNHADLLILKNTKEALESRSSMYHSAVTFANAFMNAGTTSDAFLRANLDWLGRASNWSKFSATAALGVLNKGHLAGGMSILGPYLPGNGASVAGASPYSEGGSLYALGLINAGRGAEVLEYLKNQLTAASSGGSEVVQHGAALGLGVAGMASGSEGECGMRYWLFPVLSMDSRTLVFPNRCLRCPSRDALPGFGRRGRSLGLRHGTRHARYGIP